MSKTIVGYRVYHVVPVIYDTTRKGKGGKDIPTKAVTLESIFYDTAELTLWDAVAYVEAGMIIRPRYIEYGITTIGEKYLR